MHHSIYTCNYYVHLIFIDCLLLFAQMTRDSIKNFYDGVGRPPFCEIIAKAVQSTPPDLSFTVNFGDHIKEFKIERAAEVSLIYILDCCTCGIGQQIHFIKLCACILAGVMWLG